MNHNPYLIVDEFEARIADWAGSKYAVAVESCSAAIFLSLMYRKETWKKTEEITIPSFTYPSVPCSIIHSGCKVNFSNEKWDGEYQLKPFGIWDAALRFKKGMFRDNNKCPDVNDVLQCLSFHIKKHLPIGRGGMVLTDNKHAYEWLKKARFDGRSAVPLLEDNFTQLGWNVYMEPSRAARGIQLFAVLIARYPDGMEDLKVGEQKYADLSKFPIYQQ